jgi:hypothetical protein
MGVIVQGKKYQVSTVVFTKIIEASDVFLSREIFLKFWQWLRVAGSEWPGVKMTQMIVPRHMAL